VRDLAGEIAILNFAIAILVSRIFLHYHPHRPRLLPAAAAVPPTSPFFSLSLFPLVSPSATTISNRVLVAVVRDAHALLPRYPSESPSRSCPPAAGRRGTGHSGEPANVRRAPRSGRCRFSRGYSHPRRNSRRRFRRVATPRVAWTPLDATSSCFARVDEFFRLKVRLIVLKKKNRKEFLDDNEEFTIVVSFSFAVGADDLIRKCALF